VRVLLRRLATRDPTTFIGTFAAWALSLGLGLILTHDAFSYNPAWDGLRSINPRDTIWGIVFVADGLLLLLALRASKLPHRAAITLFSSVMWCLVATSMLYCSIRAGIFSSVGTFSLWCSVQGGMAVERWIATHEKGEM
jgi:hypothetical protein